MPCSKNKKNEEKGYRHSSNNLMKTDKDIMKLQTKKYLQSLSESFRVTESGWRLGE